MFGTRLYIVGAAAAATATASTWIGRNDPLAGVGLTVLTVVLVFLTALIAGIADGAGSAAEAVGYYDERASEPLVPVESDEHDLEFTPARAVSVWPIASAAALTLTLVGVTLDSFLVFVGLASTAITAVGWTLENAGIAGRRRSAPAPTAVIDIAGYRRLAHVIRLLVLALGVVVAGIGLVRGSMVVLLGMGILAAGIVANSWMDWLLTVETHRNRNSSVS